MRERLPPLNALRAFEMAGRHLNIARAAQELGVSPGAVSQQVHVLEKWLGCRLFLRNNRGLQFTEAGEHYFASVANALDTVRDATSVVSRPEVRESFVVSVTVSFAMKWLLPRLAKFRSKWPDLDISVSTVELIGTFSASDGDVGIRYGLGDHPGMKCWELMRDELILVAAPHVIDRDPGRFALSGLVEYPLLMDNHPKVIAGYPSWEEFLKHRGLQAPARLQMREFSQQWMVIEAATNGEGIALVKSCLVIDDLNAGKLVRVSDEQMALESGYYLVCLPENADDRVVRSFRNWLKREAATGR